MYVKETYIPPRRRKRRKRFPVAMIAHDTDSSFYLFNALNAESIKKYKADQKYNPKKKEKPKKLQNTGVASKQTVDLKTVKENRKKSKKQETKRKEHVAAVKKYKFFQPEIKAFSDVTHSPNTTFDRLLHSSRKPLVDKNSMVNESPRVKCVYSGSLSPSVCPSIDKGGNRTSTPILISPIFPDVTVRDKRRNIQGLKRGDRENLLTPVLRNSIERIEKSFRHFSTFLDASDSTSLSSPVVCNRHSISGESEDLYNKIVAAHECKDSFFSPIAARTRSSIEHENITSKFTYVQNSSKKNSGLKMRRRKTTASENEDHNNTDSSVNPDESFFSTVKIKHKTNKLDNRYNQRESTRSSGKILSAILTRSKRTSESKKIKGIQEIRRARNSDKRSGIDNVHNKSNCNIEGSIPSSVTVKHKRSENRYHTRSNDQNRDIVLSSQQNKSGSSYINKSCDKPKCALLQFAVTCESPDMFSSLDEIETDIVPSKCVTVVEKCSSNFPICNSNNKDVSGRILSSNSLITDGSHGYHESCISPVELAAKSDVARKSIDNEINLSSRVKNMLHITSSVYAGPSNSTILQSSDCDVRSKSLETQFDNGGSFRAIPNKILLSDAPEVKECSRSTRKSVHSSSGAAAVSSASSHIIACSLSHDEMCTANVLPQEVHLEEEESEELPNVLCSTADSLALDYCEGQSLTHNTSVYSQENSEKSYRARSRRSSLCRRLSHVVIPRRRTKLSGDSNGSLPVSDKTAVSLSVSVIIEDDEEIPEVVTNFTQGHSSARDMVLGRCNQSEPLPFEKAFPQRYFDNCKKIGEGLYGEVFFCQYNCTPDRVLKIIPIEGAILVNGEKQKKYNEVLSELVIAMELSNLRHDAQFKTSTFVEVARCVCVQGKYPQRLIDLWNEYHEEKVSENDSPTIFDESQLFLVFELADGGKALETYCFTSAAQAFSAFVQLTFALAVAEITLEFEHRDLHWGNVLIKKTLAKNITFRLNGKEFLVPANGIQVTIIDYTLSRMSYGGCCIFNDLAVDPELFISQGDYQFEVYRLMQNTVKNEWNHFRPHTNILWLHYTLGKMLQGVHYKNVSTKIHKKFRTKLTNCYNNVLKYNSAYELVTSGNLLEMK